MISTKEYITTAKKILAEVRPLAVEYYNKTGRPIGITGEVAEYEAIRLLGYEVAPARQEGYDAIKKTGGKEFKIQIKGRSANEKSRSQKLGRISLKKEWDLVDFVWLDSEYNPVKIYQASREKIEAALTAPGSKSRNEKGQLNVSQFKKIAKVIWERN
ncbi:DUF6998 domain-containing protein [Ferruginibacter albus]|uniref:DUF6998 domain-containing protein n=1 Tax=Ferruginibacter albus TaxID=2875540 RepID=UPI001CC4E37C|nr:hypothetical protein [Ferruginibacter albus]UAY53201.1 hypothetical protein K9M53_05900 [Ferruginibacter albus]